MNESEAKEILRRCSICKGGYRNFCSNGSCFAAGNFLDGLEQCRKERERYKKALEQIRDGYGCGCSNPCKCFTARHLQIWREEVRSLAYEVLKPSTVDEGDVAR